MTDLKSRENKVGNWSQFLWLRKALVLFLFAQWLLRHAFEKCVIFDSSQFNYSYVTTLAVVLSTEMADSTNRSRRPSVKFQGGKWYNFYYPPVLHWKLSFSLAFFLCPHITLHIKISVVDLIYKCVRTILSVKFVPNNDSFFLSYLLPQNFRIRFYNLSNSSHPTEMPSSHTITCY